MRVPCNECYTLLRGDGLRRPDFEWFGIRESDGANVIAGVMRADTPDALKVNPRPSDVPFHLTIPAGLSASEFHFTVNAPICNLLRDGQPLMGLDFTPQPPPPILAEVNWGGVGLIVAALFVVGAAIGSRN